MGDETIPFIFKDFEKNDNHWFFALEVITGKNPISPEHIGNIELMKKDWTEWAQENDLL